MVENLEEEKIEYTEDDLRVINEGLVKIEFPEFDKVSSDAPVFYNPRMEFNRDTSILAIQAFQKMLNHEINVCDVFGGSGIRGVRYKKEITNIGEVSVNDISSLANEFTEINAEMNNVDINIYQKEASVMLRNHRGEFDVIDIDPFGTPSYFVDSAGYSIKRNSLLCLTATDTSALCGTYKEPCIRKYNAKPFKSEYCHENGIRILAGFAALTLAKYKKYITVLMSHSSEHYMRMYLLVKKGSKATDESLKNMGYMVHCKNCLHHDPIMGLATSIPNVCPVCGEKLTVAGPMWLGDIQNKEFISDMINISDEKELNTKDNVLKLLNTCYEEADTPVAFYDIHVVCRNLKVSAPKLINVLDSLKDQGFIAVRTHFSPLGIRTDAGIEVIKNTILKILDEE
jgi:tRNA (guanine26-N2/guanine27-N2)-dimethyltransferase